MNGPATAPPRLVWDHPDVGGGRVEALAAAMDLDPVVARLLVLRGVTTADEAERFLHPRLEHLHDPFRLADLRLAVDRLERAIDQGDRIAVHGDYDVDGVTSTVILRRCRPARRRVVPTSPEAPSGTGTGSSRRRWERLARSRRRGGSVDCGIRSRRRRRGARARHHLIVTTYEPDASLPAALAVVPGTRRTDRIH